ncbi:uncharacterized protein LOC130713520 [Lotus japonicus]|uniref:uncharacterized protein LOC130713520 n=1 Tax=Lotus japonicus TaxID=34305 RepID=UPI00258C8447|nr:uncharacterized protein LOC130713520 [Lotus japonicus]
MENRANLRVQKKKPTKRSGRKPSLKKILDYLKSDTYMYAPLVSPLPSDFPSPNAFFPSAKVVERKGEPVKELRERVQEYVNSDVYMYGPVFELPHSPQTQEPLQDCGRVWMDDSPKVLTMKVNQRTDPLGNVNQRAENHLPQKDSDQGTRGHKETVKHTVYQTCRTTSRNVAINSQLRAHG